MTPATSATSATTCAANTAFSATRQNPIQDQTDNATYSIRPEQAQSADQLKQLLSCIRISHAFVIAFSLPPDTNETRNTDLYDAFIQKLQTFPQEDILNTKPFIDMAFAQMAEINNHNASGKFQELEDRYHYGAYKFLRKDPKAKTSHDICNGLRILLEIDLFNYIIVNSLHKNEMTLLEYKFAITSFYDDAEQSLSKLGSKKEEVTALIQEAYQGLLQDLVTNSDTLPTAAVSSSSAAPNQGMHVTNN